MIFQRDVENSPFERLNLLTQTSWVNNSNASTADGDMVADQFRSRIVEFDDASDALEQREFANNSSSYPWGKVHILSFPSAGEGESRAVVERTQPFAKNLRIVSVIAVGAPTAVSLLNKDLSDSGFFKGLYVPEGVWIDLPLPTKDSPKGVQETEWRVQANRLEDDLVFVQFCERWWPASRRI